MEQESLFAVYLRDGDAFVTWIAEQHPEYVKRAEACLMTLKSLKSAPTLLVADIMAGRDAAMQLYMLADAGHFDYAASVYARAYEQLCRILLSFFPA